jgi:hypothetical protein
MLKLEQGKRNSNVARQHKGLHVSFTYKILIIPVFLYIGYVGIFEYIFQIQ